VDLVVEIDDPETALLEDELGETIDYRGLADIVLDVGEGPSVQLIERLGHKMLDRLFEEFSGIERAELTLHKFATGVPGDPESVGIELSRTRA
jgi:dihydroneopterin aldolase